MYKSRWFTSDLIKLAFTAGLVLFLAKAIFQDFEKIRTGTKHLLAPYFVLDRSKVNAKAKITTLNRLLPDSFDYLLALSQKEEKLKPEKLNLIKTPIMKYFLMGVLPE